MVYGIRYLRNRNLDEDAKSSAALQLGMVFCLLAAVTGSIGQNLIGEHFGMGSRETNIHSIINYGSLFAHSAVENEDNAHVSAVYSIIAF